MNASDIKPAVIRVMAGPRKCAGTSATVIRSRMAANSTITSENPTAAPKPYSAEATKSCRSYTFSSAAASTAQLVVISGR